MGVVARMKSMAGSSISIPTIASAATVTLPSDVSAAYITGTTAISSLSSGSSPGRHFTIFRGPSASDVPTLTNNQGSTTAGQFDLNTTATSVLIYDSIELVQSGTGTWRKADSTTV